MRHFYFNSDDVEKAYTVEDLYNANLETWSFALYRILHYIEHFMHYQTKGERNPYIGTLK